MTKTFIIAQKAGMQNGRCMRFKEIYRVGASNYKQALTFLRQKIDPTGSYTLRHMDKQLHTPKETIIPTRETKSANPLVEIQGRIYIRTDEENEQYQTKYVALHSRGNNPIVIWQ